MTINHSTTVLFVHLGNWLLARASGPEPARQPADLKSPAPVGLDAERDRLPPRDEGFYWAWQYWSH